MLRRASAVFLFMALSGAELAHAAPLEWLPVQSPFYEELEILRTEGLLDTTASLETRPMARIEVAQLVAYALAHHADRADDPGLVRLRREFSRELVRMGFEAAPRYTPPLFERRRDKEGEPPQAFRVIPYLDGAFERRPDGFARLADHSRAGLRLGIEVGNLLLYQDLFAGRVDGGRTFADPLIEHTDFIHYTEDTYLSVATPWLDLSLGRMRSGWGPGHEGSLLWSATAPPVTSLIWSKSLFDGRVRGTALSGDVDAGSQARIAAHRLDVEVTPSLHVGLSEAARYDASQWEPLYVLSIIPFSLVQRMQAQDHLPGAPDTVRNNVMIGADARWRPVRGTTLYGEVLFDDLTFRKAGTPTRIGYQAGWLGSALFLGRRLSWRGEFTRVHRYVYAVFYDRNFIHQGRPIGYPDGPDSRSLIVRGAWDWNADWRLTAAAGRLDHGEGFLGEFFDPAGPPAQGSVFAGVVEKRRFVESGARWTPRDGVAAELRWGYEWREDAAHVAGADAEGWYGRAALELRH